jgi:ankyrin repeat protein
VQPTKGSDALSGRKEIEMLGFYSQKAKNDELHTAVVQGDSDKVRYFLEKGAEVNAVSDKDASLPILRAVENSNSAITEMLLAAGADPNAICNQEGIPVLIKAVRNNSLSLVRQLLKSGADVRVSTESGDTPLTIAIPKAPIDLISELISGGADVHASPHSYKKRPLSIAMNVKRLDVLKILLDKGVNVNGYSGEQPPLLDAISACDLRLTTFFLQNGADVSGRATDGRTALQMAIDPQNASEAQAEIVNILLEAGVDAFERNSLGIIPITEAAVSGNQAAHAVLRAHIEKSVPPDWGAMTTDLDSDPDNAFGFALRNSKDTHNFELFNILAHEQSSVQAIMKFIAIGTKGWLDHLMDVFPNILEQVVHGISPQEIAAAGVQDEHLDGIEKAFTILGEIDDKWPGVISYFNDVGCLGDCIDIMGTVLEVCRPGNVLKFSRRTKLFYHLPHRFAWSKDQIELDECLPFLRKFYKCDLNFLSIWVMFIYDDYIACLFSDDDHQREIGRCEFRKDGSTRQIGQE